MPDFDLKNKVKEEGKFKNGIKNFDNRFQVGYNKFSAGIG